MADRKKVIEFIRVNLEVLSPGNKGIPIVLEFLEGLSEKAFKEKMQDGLDKIWTIPIFSPNLSDNEIIKGNAIKAAKKLELDLFHHLELTDEQTGELYTTPLKYMVLPMPVRRNMQHLVKKRSTPQNSRKVDHLSGQATGDSKGAQVSLPELLALESKGYDKSLYEMIKVNGGDAKARQAAIKATVETGGYNLDAISELNSRPKSTKTLQAVLFAMHLDNNLIEE